MAAQITLSQVMSQPGAAAAMFWNMQGQNLYEMFPFAVMLTVSVYAEWIITHKNLKWVKDIESISSEAHL